MSTKSRISFDQIIRAYEKAHGPGAYLLGFGSVRQDPDYEYSIQCFVRQCTQYELSWVISNTLSPTHTKELCAYLNIETRGQAYRGLLGLSLRDLPLGRFIRASEEALMLIAKYEGEDKSATVRGYNGPPHRCRNDMLLEG